MEEIKTPESKAKPKSMSKKTIIIIAIILALFCVLPIIAIILFVIFYKPLPMDTIIFNEEGTTNNEVTNTEVDGFGTVENDNPQCTLPIVDFKANAFSIGVPKGWLYSVEAGTVSIRSDESNTTAAFLYTAKLEKDLTPAQFLEKFGYIVEIGIYEGVFKFISFIILPITVASQVVAPDVARWFSKKRIDIVLQKALRYTLFTFAFSLSMSVVSLLLFPFIFNIILPHHDLNQIAVLFYVFIVVYIFQGVAHMIANGFSLFTGHARYNAVLLVIFGVLNIILNIWFITYKGFTGLILNKLLIGVVSNTVFLIIYFRKLIKIREGYE